MEIDQKSYSAVAQLQIRQKLSFVDGLHMVDGFKFHDHGVFDE